MKACPECNLHYPADSVTCFVDGTTLVAIRDPRIGTTIDGKYVIDEPIGEGGMATVYRARHRLVDRPCAIKIMNPSYAENETIRERFRREAKSAQKLAHPNIIEIFDQGETPDKCLYLAMELLEGQTLADPLDHGAMPIERTLSIAIQIARALARAHDLEVIHRDLKPENIFLAQDEKGHDQVKLLDFGIARSMKDARLTGTGEVFGTPQYMAPERITSIDAGHSADLYAFGIILYQMLVGELPFEAYDVANWFVKHLSEVPEPPRQKDPSIPEALEKLVLDLLEKEPGDRPVDAHRVHNDLVAIAGTIGLRVPTEAVEPASSARGPAKTLPPAALDRWVHRVALFDRMLERAYGTSPPAEQADLLAKVRDLVQEVASVRQQGVAAQRTLEGLESRGRETRQRFGHAVDALGIDASRARDELKEVASKAGSFEAEVSAAREAVKAAHKEIIFWEGRSAFAEPMKELTQAYRSAADAAEQWQARRDAQKQAEAELAKKKSRVSDLEYQIQELRAALASAEENLEHDAAACQQRIRENGDAADALEQKLMDLAGSFCAPLRGRPELRPLFQELEADAAA